MTQHPDFKGYIHDVGGPTANFRQPACEKQLTHGACRTGSACFRRRAAICGRTIRIM